nr:hypothetical protein [Tanacetum cinerariifolium]
MAESFSDQSGDVISRVTQVTGKEPIQAQSQPHSSVQGNIIGVGSDIASCKEVTLEVRFTISEEEAEEEEGSLPLI